MSKLIFRNLGGRVVPIRVETEWHQDSLSISRYQVPKRPFDPKAYATEQAFVNPNAVCGQCGASVYYYEHPNGARVLFDQLGPPWPKHPCYEASQAINRNVITQAATGAGPRWVQEGWQPLFYQKHIVLQSGEALRVQARTKRYQVIFEVPLATLQQRYIQIEQICRLLMQAKEDAGKVLIQIHDGSRSFEIMTKNIRQVEQAVPIQTATQLTEAQFASLTKLDVVIQCQRDGKRWHVNLSRHGKNHAIDFKEKNFERLKPFIYRLEAWVSKPNKKGNQTVYLMETLNRHFISSVIPSDVFSASYSAVEKPVIPEAKTNVIIQAEPDLILKSKISSADKTSDDDTMQLSKKIEGEPRGNITLLNGGETEEWMVTYCAKLAGVEFSSKDIAIVKLVSEGDRLFEIPLLKYSKQFRQLLSMLLECDNELEFMLRTHEGGGFDIMCGEISFGRLRYLVKPRRSSKIDRVVYWAEKNSTFL